MFRQTNPSSLWGVSISRQNREDGMELGSDLLKEFESIFLFWWSARMQGQVGFLVH